jgi:hypothetical protein
LKIEDYIKFYDLINIFVGKGILSPVVKSETNGMNPALFNRYRINRDILTNPEIIKRELLGLNPKLNIAYYQRHVEEYLIDREIVHIYNTFFNDGTIPEKIEKRELSFMLFSEEKYLEQSSRNYKVLKRLGLNLNRDFNCFERRQPFTFFPFSSSIKNILIVENLTPFSDLFLILKAMDRNKPVDAIVFGGGKHINASFSFFYDLFADIKTLKLIYWGDIDAAGLNIYFSLKQNFPDFDLRLWEEAYKQMMDKNKIRPDKSNINLKTYAPEKEEKELINRMEDIVKTGCVIPQEALYYSEIEELLCL